MPAVLLHLWLLLSPLRVAHAISCLPEVARSVSNRSEPQINQRQLTPTQAAFHGPALTADPPSAPELEAARALLKHSGTDAALAQKAEQTVLRAVVAQDHEAFLNSVRLNSAKVALPDPLAADCVSSLCGYGQADINHLVTAESIPGMRAIPHFTTRVVRGGQHSFNVVQMPSGRLYLVDTTFRQFFDPFHTGPRQDGAVGAFLRSDPAMSQMADDLLKNGFVELTDANADNYGRAFVAGDLRPGEAIPPKGSFNASNFLHPSADDLDFTPEEIRQRRTAPH